MFELHIFRHTRSHNERNDFNEKNKQTNKQETIEPAHEKNWGVNVA